MGVGKTTVGRVLAQNLDYAFVEVDSAKNWERYGFSRGSLELYKKDKEKYYDIELALVMDFALQYADCKVKSVTSSSSISHFCFSVLLREIA